MAGNSSFECHSSTAYVRMFVNFLRNSARGRFTVLDPTSGEDGTVSVKRIRTAANFDNKLCRSLKRLKQQKTCTYLWKSSE